MENILDRGAWAKVKLGEVASQGKTRVDPSAGGVERYVAGEHMDTDELQITRWGTVGDGYLGPAFHRGFKKGQVLYGSRRTYLRKVAFADFDGVCANTTFVVESSDPSVLLPEFLPFVMRSEAFHAHSVSESKGSVNPYVNWPDLAKYEFLLPPLEEQKRIASLLWATEKHLRDVRAVAEQARSVLNLRRQELFAKGEEKVASEVFSITIGRQRSPKHTTGTNPVTYLRSANVKHGELLLEDLLDMDFSKEEVKIYGLADGDVLVTEGCGSPDQVGAPARWAAEVTGPVCFQNTLLRYRATQAIDPGWMWQWCQHAYLSGIFRKASSGTGILHIGSTRAGQMKVRVPSRSEQHEVKMELENLEKAVQVCRSQVEQIGSLRAALLKEVLG